MISESWCGKAYDLAGRKLRVAGRSDGPDRVGQQIGHYRLLAILSTGRDASVYLAEHVHLATQVAVKLYQTRLLHGDQEPFLQELRAVARLVHPHIMRILEFGVEGDIPFLVMAYAPGGTLRQRYPAGSTLPLDAIISSVKQLAAALDYAHSQGVLHLNIKPEHMWLGRNDEILLSAFRITLFSRSSHSESIQGVVETASYMAPEQIQGYACAASDQYALGIVAYEWLCGSRPFSSTNYVEIARQQLYAPPPALSGGVREFSPAVEQVVLRALAKDAAQRFLTTQAFAGALEQSFLNRGGSIEVTPAASNSFERSPSALSEPGERNRSQQSSRLLSRRSVTLGTAGLVGAAAVVGGITWFLRPSPSTQSRLPSRPVLPGTTLHTGRGHVDSVYAVAWSRDGQSIASWSRDDTMRVWNATTFSPVHVYPVASVLSWSPDWRYIASGDAYSFQLWDTTTGRIIVVQEFPNTGAGPGDLPANGGLWSPDGKYFITPIFYTQVWDVKAGKELFSYPAAAAAWSPDSRRIALAPITFTATTPSKVQVLEVATENQVASYTLPRDISPDGLIDGGTLVWSPDGTYLASSNGDTWDAMTGKHSATYKGPLQRIYVIAWSPDSKHLASVGYLPSAGQQGKPDNAIHIWSAITGDEVLIYRGHVAAVNYFAWSPDGMKIASVSDDTTVQVWQAV
jgi:serine/threonine protein kinase